MEGYIALSQLLRFQSKAATHLMQQNIRGSWRTDHWIQRSFATIRGSHKLGFVRDAMAGKFTTDNSDWFVFSCIT